MNRVLLPRTLFVTNKGHTEDSSKNMHEKLKEDSQYILCATQNHRGKSAYGGHYVAEAMDWTTVVWYEYNSEEVTLLPNGSNSSYYPLVSDTKFSQDTSTSAKINQEHSLHEKRSDRQKLCRHLTHCKR